MAASRETTLLTRIWSNRHFYGFVSPFFFLFAVFGLYPLLFSFYLSFQKWDGLTDSTYIALENFRALFLDDSFYLSLWNTLLIGALHIPPMFVLAFLFASILNAPNLRFRAFFRMAVFFPCITPMVVIAIVFSLLYSAESGLLNFALKLFTSLLPWGPVPPIPWLENGTWSKISIAILLVWRWTGYNMILMLAGLQGISAEYYEAARLDGASKFQQMWHITLPLLRPTLVYCTIMSLLGTVYMFDEIFVLTQGGPGMATTNFGVYLFNVAFTDYRFGYASSAAYTVAFIVFLISLAILKWRKVATD